MTFDDVQVGDELPPFEVALTVQRMVMECGVNKDWTPIHHDREVARAQGAPDMFVNTLFLQAMYEATAREWAGLDARLRKLKFKMKTFNCAGDNLAGMGRVASKEMIDGKPIVNLEMWTESERGVTTAGEVVLELGA
jgi:acyl dehydratase